MTEILIHIGIAIWWSIAVVVFTTVASDADEPAEAISVAMLWPLFAVLYLPVVLWRILFKTAKTIRADLENRGLLREFEDWYQAQILPKEDDQDEGKT